MIQIKYFDGEDPGIVQAEINNFLLNPKIEYIDVKFNSVISSEAYNEEILFSIILIYKEV